MSQADESSLSNTSPAKRAQRDNAGGPLRPRWYLVVFGFILAGLAVLVDEPVTRFLTSEDVRDEFQRLWLRLGGPLPYFFIIAILASFPNRRRLIVGFMVPLLLSAFVTHLLKWVFGRARPETDLGLFYFRPFEGAAEFASFPSGHASAAATFTLLLAIYFPRARWFFYSLAVMIALERIFNDKHFLSDVLAGFAIGVGSVYACVHLLGAEYYRKDRPDTPDASNATNAPD